MDPSQGKMVNTVAGLGTGGTAAAPAVGTATSGSRAPHTASSIAPRLNLRDWLADRDRSRSEKS
ncbi:hypothetical protein [Mycolicibacterium hippocampi]|uniref:hypothetical protein n=1 Tax=Mycobacteriaceae TaxID=1762 RepID=UPI0015B3858B|nr:hypothetical protein [Mycolicibacterium hippocampi]